LFHHDVSLRAAKLVILAAHAIRVWTEGEHGSTVSMTRRGQGGAKAVSVAAKS